MRHGQYRDEDSKRDPERDTTSATSPRGVARAPRWPNSPDLAGNAPLRRRLSRASPAARRCHRRRSIEQVYSRFARARDARNLPWSLTSDPRFRPRQQRPVAPLARREFFARDPARANRPLDPHAITPRTRSRLRPRLHFAPTQIPIRRASRDRGRARRARDAVPPRTPRDENPASQGTTRQAVVAQLFREIRARTPRSRDLPRSLPRCSPLGIVKDDSSFDVRRVARACVRRDRHRQRRRVVPHRSGSRQLGCCPTCGGVVAAEFIIRNFRCGSREDLTRERLVETVEAVASNARFLGAPRALPMVSSGWRERSSANSVVHPACVITTTSARRSTTASPPRFYLIRPRRPRCTLER